MTDYFVYAYDDEFNKLPEFRSTIQNLSKYVIIIPQYLDKRFNLFQKYKNCPSKYDRDFVRKRATTLGFQLNLYCNYYYFEDTFRLLPSLIMNSVNRHHISYKSSILYPVEKVVPILNTKMLKYGFGNVKFIGKYRCSSIDEFEKFLTSHRPTKCYNKYKYTEFCSFHHCKMCKDLTSHHRRSMFAFILDKFYNSWIYCFILF